MAALSSIKILVWVLQLGSANETVDPWLSRPCAEARQKYGLNFTKLQALSWKHYRQGKGERFVESSVDPELLRVAKETWRLRDALEDVKSCPAAVVVAAGILMLFEVTFSYSLGTNVEYERHFHRMHMYQRGVFDNFPVLTEVMDMLWWPVKESVQMQIRISAWLQERVEKSMPYWDPEEEHLITDEAHQQALEDVKEVMEEAGVQDWFPYCGTLVALLRHGQRAGTLATGRDVVDHDVDVMVGVESEMAWLMLRWTINMKLRDRGWDTCFGRTSVDAPDVGSKEYRMAREDLILCTRQKPAISLDIGSYIIGGHQVVYAQRFCDHVGCYIPRDVGTFRTGKGFIRKSSIYPLGRCKAGHLSVPCPRKPLDVLRVVMPGWNFTEQCLALPDVAQRRLRGFSDDEQWIRQSLQPEDVEVLQQRAAELEAQGYMSMAPYFSSCRMPH